MTTQYASSSLSLYCIGERCVEITGWGTEDPDNVGSCRFPPGLCGVVRADGLSGISKRRLACQCLGAKPDCEVWGVLESKADIP
jgi:hypothetical protein